MRKTVKLLLGIAFCLTLGACTSGQTVSYDISSFLDSFTAMDYSAMFAQCAPAVDVDEETFMQKYDAIFSGLDTQQVVIDDLSGPDEDGVYTYTATYKTKDYGDLTNEFTLKAGIKDGQSVVLWDYSLIFPEMEEGYSVRVETLEADRGEIFAEDGSLLAANAYADTLYMDTSKVQNISDVADVVCPINGMTETEIIEKFNEAMENETQIISLGAFFADELTKAQRKSVLSVPGLGIDDKMYTPIRDYPLGEYAAHIIGYTGYYDADKLPEGYTAADKAGLSGLESAYESQMRGKDGKIVYIEDKWGRNIRTLYEVPCEQGQDLRLTIKPNLQKRAYDALKAYLPEGETGAAIVMDASTGYVEAMASCPSFDNNLFTFPLSDELWESLNAPDSNRPLFSRATQGQYPPGSVFKPFTATAALEAGAITPDTVFTGKIVANKWTPDDEDWDGPPITRIDDSGSPLKAL